MHASALPYFLYFLVDLISVLIFVVVNVKLKRPVLSWAQRWLIAGTVRYAMVVFSSGEQAIIDRDVVIWWIRSLVALEAILYICVMIAFVHENVNIRGSESEESKS